MPCSALFFLLPHSPNPQLCIACASEAQELPGSRRAALGTPRDGCRRTRRDCALTAGTACAGVGAALSPAAFGDRGLQTGWLVGTSSAPHPAVTGHEVGYHRGNILSTLPLRIKFTPQTSSRPRTYLRLAALAGGQQFSTTGELRACPPSAPHPTPRGARAEGEPSACQPRHPRVPGRGSPSAAIPLPVPVPTRHPGGHRGRPPFLCPSAHLHPSQPNFPRGCGQGPDLPARLPGRWSRKPEQRRKVAGRSISPPPRPPRPAVGPPPPGSALTACAAPASGVLLCSQRSAFSFGSWSRKEVGGKKKKK